jgi:hypothetical protein
MWLVFSGKGHFPCGPCERVDLDLLLLSVLGVILDLVKTILKFLKIGEIRLVSIGLRISVSAFDPSGGAASAQAGRRNAQGERLRLVLRPARA